MKKKILSILITVLSLCTCMFTLTACGENEPPHTHIYSVLKYDTENHWHECSCGEKKDIENHKGGTVTETNKATCSVCNQEYGESLGHVHTLHLTKVDAKPQSCTKEGNREYYTCSCGKWFTDNTATTEITDKDSVVIEKDDHKYETLKKTATEHWWECFCGAYETKESHKPGVSATETTDQKCTECQYVIAPALGHVHTLHLTKVDAKPQSCTKEGNIEYYTCSCDKWFTDNTATTEITDKTSVVIEKDDHKYETLKKTTTEHWWECSCGDKDGLEEHHGGNATCTQKAVCDDCGTEYGSKKSHSYTELKQSATQHWYECSCGAYETKENHIPGAVATETTDQKCTECNYVITPALGHVHTLHLTKVYAKQQSCTATGNVEYYTCSCGKWFTDNIATTEITDKNSVVIEKDAHKYETLKKTTTEHWWECSCGAYETKENHKGGTATCQVKATCSVCDTVYGDFAEHESKTAWVITDTHHYHECAYGCTVKLNYSEHSFTNYVSNKDATYESDGTKTAQCDGGCGETHTVTDVGSMLIKDEIRFTTLTVNDKNVYGKVSNATTEFVFYEEIVVSGNATYVVDNDKDCSSPIDSKTVDLVVGDNTFYVLETVGNNVKLYTVIIHRREMFTVTFNTNGGTAVDSQIIEEDSFATEPTTSKTGYTFDGWDYDFNTAITSDITITANWNTIEYSIVYNLNGGSLSTTKNSYTIEQAVTFDNPTRDYYTFSGWYNNADFNGSKITKITIGTYGDIELYAKWTPINYNITYVLNGGTNDKNNPTKYNVETSTITLNNPTRDGYTFDGWYLEEAFNTKVIQIEQGSHGNVKLYAKWNIVEYDIIYNLNGGNISTDKTKYTIEQAVTFDNPTRDCYTFSGWYDNVDFSGDAVTGIVVGTYNDIELYAKWTPIDYTITYNYGYGDEIEVVPTNAYTIINDSTYKWTLSNGVWTSGNKGVNSSTSVYKITANSNLTVTFDYKVSSETNYDKLIIAKNGTALETVSGSTSYVSYTITLNAGDSLTFTYSKDSSEHKNDDKAYIKNLTYVVEPCIEIEEIVATEIYNIETQTFDLITPTRDGYTFNGWYLEQTFKTKVTHVEQGSYGDITLYAKWTENVNVLNFNGNGNTSGSMTAIELKTGETTAIPLNTFVKTGYTFKGWSKVANGEVVYNDGANYTMGTESQYTLYAVWEANLNTLTFNGNGATGGSTSSMQIRTDASKALNANGFTRAGYTFKGWSTSANGTVEFEDGDTYLMGTDSEYTLYAVWEANLNTLTFNGNGKTGGSTSSMQIRTDASVTLNSNGFTRTGYTFRGWSTSANGSAVYTDGANYTMGANSSYTLYAVWEANLNTIYFNANGATNGEMSSIQARTGETITLPSNVYYLSDDYTFGGWAISETGSSKYYDGATYVVSAEAEQTLYACWKQQTKDGLSWILSNNEVTITDCLTSVTNIVIPSTIANYPVTSIGSSAFEGCKSLTSVVIGDSVTIIGESAFKNCSKLTSIEIPNSVTSIGSSAFSGCSSLIYNIKDGLKYLGNSTNNYLYLADTENTSITTAEIDSNCRIIGNGAFYNCSSLTNVTIPDSVTIIGSSAFEGCSLLTNVTIGDSVTSIGYEAFYNCSSLTSIVIPDNVTSIGVWAFYNCSKLTRVNYLGTIDSWVQIEFGNYCSNPLYYAKKLYINDELITNIVLTTATKISYCAFYGCSSLTEVTIGNSVTSIGDGAFYGCSSLTSIVIPDSVTSIGSSAFYNCTSLTNIEIPDSVTSIGSSAFKGCSSLSSITLPFVGSTLNGTSNTHFGYLFGASSYEDNESCVPKSLKTVVITGGAYIDYAAFYGCTSLNTLSLPFAGHSQTAYTGSSGYMNHFGYIFGYNRINDYIEGWHPYDFYYYGEYYQFYIPSSLNRVIITGTKIHDYAFSGCDSFTMVIGESVTSIGSSAFSNCSSLTSLTIPDSVTSIGDYAFSDCSKLTKVNYTGTIDQWAQIEFVSSDSNPLYCAKNLYINDVLVTEANITTKISDYAFYNCSSLTNVTIGDSVTSIGSSAFKNCTALTSIEIPNSVTSIGSSAFSGCSSLTSIEIPNSVTSIGSSAFGSNLTYNIEGNLKYLGNASNPYLYLADTISSYITSATINENCKIIGSSVFEYCRSLTSITIPNSVTSIGSYAFYKCDSLTSVTIGNSVTSIGSFAFYDCTSLEEINFNATNCADLSYENCVFAYAGQNGEGITVTFGDNVTHISACLFCPDRFDTSYSPKITSVTIGNSVTSIGERAFEYCSSLTSVTIGNSVTSIGYRAFYDCDSLTSVKYRGTSSQWQAITKGGGWNSGTGNYTITYNYTGE